MIESVQLTFTRRSVEARPRLDVAVSRVARDVWPLFRPWHYMSADLSKTSSCYGSFVGEEIAAFVAVIYFPHAKKSACGFRVHRLVTLPDWQGIGLGMLLLDTIASAYAGLGHLVKMPAAHPSLIRTLDRSPRWALTKRPGEFTRRNLAIKNRRQKAGRMGGRPCAVFRYVGGKLAIEDARRLVAHGH